MLVSGRPDLRKLVVFDTQDPGECFYKKANISSEYEDLSLDFVNGP